MIGMAYKDILVQRKTILWYLLFFAVYTGMCAAGTMTISILGGFVVMAGFVMPVNSITCDGQVKWEMFAAAAPGRRREMVGGKYLFSLLVTAGSAVLALAASLLLYALDLTEEPPLELVLIVTACAGVGIFLNCILLPLIFQFGVEKGRVIMLAVFVAVFAVCIALGRLGRNKLSLLALPPWLWGLLPVVLVIFLAAVVSASICVSLRICGKKEF